MIGWKINEIIPRVFRIRVAEPFGEKFISFAGTAISRALRFVV